MNVKKLCEAYRCWCQGSNALVLATVVATEGSTYSKSGARMLIDANGDFEGLLSGGCLEGDLIEHARRVIDTGKSEIVSYDMRGTDDEFWGLGVGCDGAISILLQRLHSDDNFEPLATMVKFIERDEAIVSAAVVATTIDKTPLGASSLCGMNFHRNYGIGDSFIQQVSGQAEKVLSADSSLAASADHEFAGESITVLYSRVDPAPRILVLGAGPDALPVVQSIAQLGWTVMLVDHRPSYLDRIAVDSVANRLLQSPASLHNDLDLNTFSAAVVMSHNLAADRQFLSQLAESDIPFIGLLGPKARKARLLDELGDAGIRLQQRVHGPVGFDIGANTPESIALSIAAQIHASIRSARGEPMDCSARQ
jgi:xanthine/CO dehydrogenase XdhC/CoxF family maturation factor